MINLLTFARGAVLALVLALCAGAAVSAQTPAAPSTPIPSREEEQKAAGEAADRVAKQGPAEIALRDQGVIRLPKGYSFVPQPEAGRLLHAYGGAGDDPDMIGVILPDGAGEGWWAKLEFVKSGYVKDDEARDWDADALLKNLKDGTEAANEQRVARGFKPIEVTGWAERPQYDAATHRLVWSAIVRRKDDPSDAGSANYNTYLLGRDGYFSLDLVTALGAVDHDKQYARDLLGSIDYVAGKGYGDFNASTDRIAEFGIAALIGGVAAKKLGLLALAGVFLLKVWKVAAVAVFAVVAGGKRILAMFRKPPPPAPTA